MLSQENHINLLHTQLLLAYGGFCVRFCGNVRNTTNINGIGECTNTSCTGKTKICMESFIYMILLRPLSTKSPLGAMFTVLFLKEKIISR